MNVGRAFGMIADDATDSATMRSSFFIDPDGIIRASCCYPPTVGRSVDEMLRVIAALQRVDADHIVTPAGWQPGDDVLLPPSSNRAAVLAMPYRVTLDWAAATAGSSSPASSHGPACFVIRRLLGVFDAMPLPTGKARFARHC